MISITDVSVDAELESFLPSLTADEFATLKSSVESDGFTDPIIVWMNKGVIVDGHNRYRAWKELGSDPDKAPEVTEKRFVDRAAVMQWMFTRQDSRRNWTPAQKAAVALKMKPAIEERAKDNKGGRPSAKKPSTNSSKVSERADTRKEVAKIAGVSEDTVRKTEVVLKDAPEAVKQEMLAGTKSVNAAFKETKAAQAEPRKSQFDPVELERQSKKNGLPTIVPFDDKPADKAIGVLRRHLDERLKARPGTERFFNQAKFALNSFTNILTEWKDAK